MSLRRRITLATTVAVALVALTVGAVGYYSTRNHLISSTQGQLMRFADQFRNHSDNSQPGGPGDDGGGDSGPASPSGGPGDDASGLPNGLPRPQFGGATGYFQTVRPNGTSTTPRGVRGELPVDQQVLQIARSGQGSFFRDASVKGVHVEVLTVADPSNHTAIEVALPLTSTDDVLHGLLLVFILLVGGGILLAGLIGTLVARSALAPITRFSKRTEEVTGVIDERHTGSLVTPPRLEESGATELRRLAFSFNQTLDALERSIQAQRHLIADASHELRTPMASLRSNVQIFLEADRLPVEERVELQEAIVAELDELTQLVADVLDLARGTAPSDHVEPLELDVLVREATARAARRAPTLQFTSEIEPTLIVNAPDRVARAITNVIDNACKWSPEGGEIKITLAGGVLTVRDHGPGFKESDLQFVFDRFYRADEARRLPGSGLGLAIVRQAAQPYGGYAQVSNATDGGAIVTVVFGSKTSESLIRV